MNAEGTTVVRNPHAWTEAFNVIYVDQPVGSGWSYHSNDTKESRTIRDNSRVSSYDLVAFLKLFGEAFPEYASKPLHIGGEAFGSRSAVVLAEAVMEYNLHLAHGNGGRLEHAIPLTSVIIVNG